MKTEKIKLVFGDGERRKNNKDDWFPLNHWADEIKEFRIGDSDDFSYGILECCTGDARFRIKLDKDAPDYACSLLYEYEDIHHEGCFYTLSRRLGAVNAIDGPYADILFESYDAPENPIMSYRYIDDDHGKLSIHYPMEDVPWFKEDIEAVVSKKDLFEAFYVGFIKQIIKYYDGIEWVFDNDGYFGSKESNLYNFFNKDIDRYLKANGVKDIDELVQKAKDKIKADLPKVYEEWDRLYNKEKE